MLHGGHRAFPAHRTHSEPVKELVPRPKTSGAFNMQRVMTHSQGGVRESSTVDHRKPATYLSVAMAASGSVRLLSLVPLVLWSAGVRPAAGQDTGPRTPGLFQHEFASCPDSIDADSLLGAQRCAEAFVIAQGYTASPPTFDSTNIVYEFVEAAETWREVLERRHNTVRVPARAVCSSYGHWFSVVFAPPDTASPRGRAVRVRKDFTEVGMVHQEVWWQRVVASPGCNPVGQTRPRPIRR